MTLPLPRRTVLSGALALSAASTRAADPPPNTSRLLSTRIATIAAADPKKVADAYVTSLTYKIRETSSVTHAMAESWDAPRAAGQPLILLSTDANPDVFIRVIGTEATPGASARTTAGWSSFEMIVRDADALHAALQGSAFKTLTVPTNPVKLFPTIKSFKVKGPADEVLFLTCDYGDPAKSILSVPAGPVGHPDVMWISGPDILKVRDWFATTFAMTPRPVTQKPIPGSQDTIPNTVLLMKRPHQLLQFEGNPAQFAPRPHGAGHLPPGNAMGSFLVADLEALKLPFITPPRALYGKTRAATVRDPNGNRVELIEDRSL
jgi:hypothetical protein